MFRSPPEVTQTTFPLARLMTWKKNDVAFEFEVAVKVTVSPSLTTVLSTPAVVHINPPEGPPVPPPPPPPPPVGHLQMRFPSLPVEPSAVQTDPEQESPTFNPSQAALESEEQVCPEYPPPPVPPPPPPPPPPTGDVG